MLNMPKNGAPMILYFENGKYHEIKSLKNFPDWPRDNRAVLECRFVTSQDKDEFEHLKELASRNMALRLAFVRDRSLGYGKVAVHTAYIDGVYICNDGLGVLSFKIICDFEDYGPKIVNFEELDIQM